MDIERERFETETDLENLLFDKTVEFRKSLREPVSVNRFPYGWRKEVPFLLADGCYAALARLPVKRLKDARRLIRLLANAGLRRAMPLPMALAALLAGKGKSERGKTGYGGTTANG